MYVVFMNTAASLNSFEAGMTSSSLSPWITEQCGTYDGDVSAGGTAVLECSADDLPVGRYVSHLTYFNVRRLLRRCPCVARCDITLMLTLDCFSILTLLFPAFGVHFCDIEVYLGMLITLCQKLNWHDVT